MPLKQFPKQQTSKLNDLGVPSKYNNKGVVIKAGLFRVNNAGIIEWENSPEGVFLINPSTWNEDKPSHWVPQQVPGQSDPVFQWISSGPRTVNFDALITADTSDFDIKQNIENQKKAKPKSMIEAIADQAAKLFKVQIPPPRTNETVKSSEVLDISDTLNYYRSLLYPVYTDPYNNQGTQRLRQSPPLLVLLNGSAIAKLPYHKKISIKNDVWVLTDLKIRVTKQLPNLAPMEATVSFTLMQYNIKSFDRYRFYPTQD